MTFHNPKIRAALSVLLLSFTCHAVSAASNIAQREADVKRNPRSIEARLALGWGYYEAGQKDRAETEFRVAVALDPANVEPLISISNLYKERKNYKEAMAYFRKAIGIAAKKKGSEAAALSDMKSSLNYSSYAWLFIDMGQPDKAIPMLKAAIKLAPDELNNYQALCAIYSNKHNPAETLKWFRQGLAVAAKATATTMADGAG
ncbi:MAG TPA: tetratricopeptide repeat protein, partial [Elusimicrobiales bacterium]|nr:tetratricopeptide repeat protein [Elusimicrobiales bacterium]